MSRRRGSHYALVTVTIPERNRRKVYFASQFPEMSVHDSVEAMTEQLCLQKEGPVAKAHSTTTHQEAESGTELWTQYNFQRPTASTN